jgi:hypothetical protein
MAYKPKILALNEGGTNASLTASNGGIVYSTASAAAILSGTATANKVLMSGASTTPSWSTPTFPNASATSGKFIRSDGTNWIASTPTLPTTGGTSDTLLRSDGTNWVNTSTFKVSSGDILTATSQPAIKVQVNTVLTDVTGDGTNYVVVFDTVGFQQGSNFNTGTGKYTTPSAGIYFISYTLTLSGLAAAFTSGLIDIIANGTAARKLFNPGVGFVAATTEYSVSDSVIASVGASSDIYLNINVAGSTKTIDIKAQNFGPYSYMSIMKLA